MNRIVLGALVAGAGRSRHLLVGGRAQVERAAPPPEPLATTGVARTSAIGARRHVGPAPPKPAGCREQRRSFATIGTVIGALRVLKCCRAGPMLSASSTRTANLLDFEEWAVATVTKFEGADADGDNDTSGIRNDAPSLAANRAAPARRALLPLPRAIRRNPLRAIGIGLFATFLPTSCNGGKSEIHVHGLECRSFGIASDMR